MKPFPWRPGMRFLRDGDGYRIITLSTYEARFWAWAAWDESPTITNPKAFLTALDSDRPDPDDGPTKGALLDAVREAWKDPGIACAPAPLGQVQIEIWEVYPFAPHLPHTLGGGDSEFAALLAAWEAAP